MSHHSTSKSLADMIDKLSGNAESRDGLAERQNFLRQEMMAEQLQSSLGPTGEYTNGKLSPDDEGGLMVGITNFNGRVVLDFGKPVQSIGLTRPEALQLAKTIADRAKQCPPIIGEEDPF